MARTRSEARAISKAVASLDAVIQTGGSITYRVAVNHRDDDHDVAPVPFHYGPAYNEGFAQTAAEVLGVSPATVDLYEHAQKGLERARAEYPEADGYEHWIEAVVPDKVNEETGAVETHAIKAVK